MVRDVGIRVGASLRRLTGTLDVTITTTYRPQRRHHRVAGLNRGFSPASRLAGAAAVTAPAMTPTNDAVMTWSRWRGLLRSRQPRSSAFPQEYIQHIYLLIV